MTNNLPIFQKSVFSSGPLVAGQSCRNDDSISLDPFPASSFMERFERTDPSPGFSRRHRNTSMKSMKETALSPVLSESFMMPRDA
jgi:hypothetical protein